MQEFKVNELKPHPRNSEFFDNISGEKWKEFLDSIKTRGVIEPIVITPNKIIVSGHQRVRACKELGIEKVMCDVHTYDNDDQILQDLLETNIRQRGDIGGSAQKVGKRIKELERIYGVHQGDGSNQYKQKPNSSVNAKSQNDIAELFGISVDTLQNYKMLTDMIPELSDLVDTGIVTKTTALAIMKQLSSDDQKSFIENLPVTDEIANEKIEASGKKYTQKDIQKYIDDCKREKSRADELAANPKVVTESVTIKEIPADYESTKTKLDSYKKENARLTMDFQEKVKELQDVRKQLDNIKSNDPVAQYDKKLKDSVLIFCNRVYTFIEQVGGYVWLSDEINKLPDLEKAGYIKAVNALTAWSDTINYNINNNTKEIK